MKRINWPGRTKLERMEMTTSLIFDVILYIPRLIMKLL